MWREYIESLTSHSTISTCSFFAGATLAQVEELENLLEVVLPQSLKTLLQETNGVEWRILFRGDEIVLPLIWPIKHILTENLSFRKENPAGIPPFESLLLWGSEGNGDQFGFGVIKGQIPNEDVFDCSHDGDELKKTSPSLWEHAGSSQTIYSLLKGVPPATLALSTTPTLSSP